MPILFWGLVIISIVSKAPRPVLIIKAPILCGDRDASSIASERAADPTRVFVDVSGFCFHVRILKLKLASPLNLQPAQDTEISRPETPQIQSPQPLRNLHPQTPSHNKAWTQETAPRPAPRRRAKSCDGSSGGVMRFWTDGLGFRITGSGVRKFLRF